MLQQPAYQTLYDQDYLLWTEDTAQKIKSHRFDNLEIETLVEEIRGLGRLQKRELKNHLRELLENILKRTYVRTPELYQSWVESVIKQRTALEDLLAESPSLQFYLSEVFDSAYQSALQIVYNTYPQYRFPYQWPFERSPESLLTIDFWKLL